MTTEAKEHIELATAAIMTIDRFINVCVTLNNVSGRRYWEFQRDLYITQREYYKSLIATNSVA